MTPSLGLKELNNTIKKSKDQIKAVAIKYLICSIKPLKYLLP